MTTYQLDDLYKSIDAESRTLQFGTGEQPALTLGFSRKRVVHAGISGKILAPHQVQDKWKELMAAPAPAHALQVAYVHIPFCKTKCLYCGFFQNATKQSIEDEYIDHLIAELEEAKDAPRLKTGRIHAVFIGGGTPSSLSTKNAARLLKAIRTALPLANDYEMTLEGRIHDLVPEKIEAWLAGGVNRVSLGVQSFHTDVRKSQGRIETREEVLSRLKLLKSYQECSVVIDLIYGLPLQSMDVWRQDLKDLVEVGVDGADLYQLNVFEGSDLNQRIADGKLPPAASTEQQAEMYAVAHDVMSKVGWRPISYCHWAATNRERSLYNAYAKEGVTMFPFGSGAGGFLDGYAIMMHRALTPYTMIATTGTKPIMGLVEQPDAQPFSNRAVAMLERGFLDLEELYAMDARLKGLSFLYELWEKNGFVHFNGLRYELTVAGKFWEVNLAQTTVECIQYLFTGENSVNLEKISAQDSPMKKVMQTLAMQAEEKEGVGGMGGMNGMVQKEGLSMAKEMPSVEMMREMAKQLGIKEMPSIEQMKKMAAMMKTDEK